MTADLRDLVIEARNSPHGTTQASALAELSILAESYLVAGDRWTAGTVTLEEFHAAEADLRAVLPLSGESRIAEALQGIGADALPRPDWQARVLARVELPSWWRRLWRWLSW